MSTAPWGAAAAGAPPVRPRSGLLENLGILLGVVLMFAAFYGVVTTPLSLWWQAGSGAVLFIAALILRKRGDRRVSLVLMALSTAVSSRYLYWRISSTLPIGQGFDALDLFFAIGLIMAELYAFVVLVLGYFQVMWPLQRRPEALPEDTKLWPVIDVFIPTYNEPLKVVRPTVLAALDMDWPRDKIKIFLLDDGRREEMREFCEQVGAIHVTRSDNAHAKAGNINQALKNTHGEYVAIFDCDHIPTRSFLQMTIGTMVNDSRMGLVQTPHHFFSPDPFERNLGTFRTVPNEGELFYGLIQDGNDYWNAAFFCGSCAVLRRTAIEQIGGIATETVTEDAHTALRMHSLGWDSAYINIPQAAGLATESLSGHVGQRVRWARGMAQISRIDNPLLKRGLSWGQRLCYANAMLHFFYGIPRLVFLTSPLAFLIANANIIRAQGFVILAYSAPHLLLAMTANSRIQGRYRYSFWAEVYETVLGIFIILPTTLAFINPKLGKFNVTAKGGIIEKDYFDAKIARPYYILYLINFLGLLVGFLRLIFGDPQRADTVTLNVVWTFYNMLVIGAALCVASETKQVRTSVRIKTRAPVVLRKKGVDTIFESFTLDLSSGGLAMTTPDKLGVVVGEKVDIALIQADRPIWTPATVRGSGKNVTTLEFATLNLEQERQIVGTLFGRVDSWMGWRDARARDRPLLALVQVTRFSFIGAGRFFKWAFQQIRHGMSKPPAPRASGAAAAMLLTVLALGAATVPRESYAATAPVADSEPITSTIPANDVTSKANFTTDFAFAETGRQIKFVELGQRYPLKMQSVFSQASLPLSVRHDQVITKATLHLEYGHSPSLIPHLSHLNVLVNNELISTIPLTDATASGTAVDIPINPALLGMFNQLRLEAVQHYTDSPLICEDPTHTSLWSLISDRTYITVTIAPLNIAPTLSTLPGPFFDAADTRKLNLPVAFASKPGRQTETAAAVVASWFGLLADYRGAEFPALLSTLPKGHGVVFRVGEAMSDRFGPGAKAPRLRVVANPEQPNARLLLIEAPDEAGVLQAAQALTLGAYVADGSVAEVHSLQLPELAKLDAAPHWLDPTQVVTLHQMTADPTADKMSVRGLVPGPISFDFHLAPDTYFLRETGAIVDLRYRYSPVTAVGSSLSTLLNDGFLGGVVLSDAGKPGLSRTTESYDEAKMYLPSSRLAPNDKLIFQYQFRRDVQKPCQDFNFNALGGSVDPDSQVSFGSFAHFALWPDLGRFRDGGLPFTLYPDLARTTILMPDTSDEDALTAMMTVSGHLGHITGLTALRVTVDSAASASNYPDHELLMIGRADELPQLNEWKDNLPITFGPSGATLRSVGAFSRWQANIEGRDLTGALKFAGRVLLDAGNTVGALVGAASPYSHDHAIVILTAGVRGRLADVSSALIDPARNQFIDGDLSLVRGDQVTGYQLDNQFSLGKVPASFAARRWTGLHPYLVAPIFILLAIIVALVLFPLLRARARRRTAHNAGR